MADECKDGCAKMKHACNAIDSVKKTLFGEDGLGGIAGEVKTYATWGWFWTVFAFIALGVAGSHIRLNSSIAQCADKEDVKASIIKMEENIEAAKESTHRQEIVVTRIEGIISPLIDIIADEKERSITEDVAIRKTMHINKDEMNKKLERLERKVDRLTP